MEADPKSLDKDRGWRDRKREEGIEALYVRLLQIFQAYEECKH